MTQRGIVTAVILLLMVATAPVAAADTDPGTIAGEDCTVETDDLREGITAWAQGDLSTDDLRTLIRHWASGQPIPNCGSGLSVTVTDVVDGDTIDVRYENGSTDTVRLVGVDTPEVHVENQPTEFEGIPDSEAGRTWLRGWGENASTFVEDRLGGKTVRLTFDEEAGRRGAFGRLLAYVHLNSSFELNAALVEQGYARVYTEGDFQKEDQLVAAETTARDQNVGLWAFNGSDTPTSNTTDGLTVTEIHADAAGNDHENLNDEYVVFENAGNQSLDLTGWTVSDEADHTYQFPSGFTLDPGETVTLYTGSGTDTESELYWGSGSAIWNNGGDTVIVTDGTGEVVLEEEYS